MNFAQGAGVGAGALFLTISMLPAWAAGATCAGPTFTAPLVRDFRTVVMNCQAGRCAPAYLAADAPLDDALFGTSKLTIAALRQLAAKADLPPFLMDVHRAIRSKRYRDAFAAYYWQFRSFASMTGILDFQYGEAPLRLQEFLRQASTAPVTDAQISSLSSLCRVHYSSKQLRLYAALVSLERDDSDEAIQNALTVPYLREGAPDQHYFAMDYAAIGQALDIDSAATVRILTSLRADVVKKLNTDGALR